MNEHIKFLAEKAGFIFWSSEEWKPENAEIDWSSDYSDEFQKFIELMVKDCIEVCNNGTTTQTTSSGVATILKLRYGV